MALPPFFEGPKRDSFPKFHRKQLVRIREDIREEDKQYLWGPLVNRPTDLTALTYKVFFQEGKTVWIGPKTSPDQWVEECSFKTYSQGRYRELWPIRADLLRNAKKSER